MAMRRVIVEMREPMTAGALASPALAAVAPALAGLTLDASFGPVSVPSRSLVENGPLPLALLDALPTRRDPRAGAEETYIVRGRIEDSEAEKLIQSITDRGPLVGVFADPPIQPFLTGIGSPAVGDDRRIEELLGVAGLQQRGMTGEGVYVAIVDTGINLAYLKSKGKAPSFNKELSWVPDKDKFTPGMLPVHHGTMCAFDVCIAAPRCTLLDIAVLLSEAPGGTAMEGLLSDAVKAYEHLRSILRGPSCPKALVVSNSWGMFHPSWDYPVGHPGNYSDNPDHPFNRMVRTLEREGADILFAAGNCGSECPDGRCGNVTNAIYGANSHPKVLCVGGVDANNERVGYSTQGPGRLARDKPDVCGYTHFKGSEVWPIDSGTSAATPVVAGVVAAVRTVWPYRPDASSTWPRVVRQLIERTAIDRGNTGYDLEYGWGVLNTGKFTEAVAAAQAAEGKPVPAPAAAGPMGVTAGAVPKTVLPPQFTAAAGTTAFVRLYDAQPGRNVQTLSGFPPGTRAISLWVTEWIPPNNPQAGEAVIFTLSVQLFDNGTQCRLIFDVAWNYRLPVAAQIMFGPG